MELLDFAPEIFQHIVHDHVSDVGFFEALKLRTVCRTFAAEIKHDIFANQTKDILPLIGWNRRTNKFLAANFGLYLFNRIKSPLDANQRFLNRIVELTEYCNLPIRELCDRISAFMDPGVLECTVWPHEYDFMTTWEVTNLPEIISDQTVVAICLPGVTHLSTFGDFISGATGLNSVKIVLAMIESFEKSRQALGEDFTINLSLDVYRAILVAISMLNLLVDWYKKISGSPWAKDRGTWIKEAVKSGSMELLEAVLAHHTTKAHKRSHQYALMDTIFARATPSMVTALIQDGRIDIGKKFRSNSELISATKSGNLSNMQVVLDAGADINYRLGKGRGKTTTSALDIAIMKENTGAMELLLDRGAEIPRMEVWPRKVRIWKVLRKASIERSSNDVPSLNRYLKRKQAQEERRIRKENEALDRALGWETES